MTDDLSSLRKSRELRRERFWSVLSDVAEIESHRSGVARLHGSFEIAAVNGEGLPDAAARYRKAVMALNRLVASACASWELDPDHFRFRWTLAPSLLEDPAEP
jgi:hypothetical protein